MGPNTSFSEGFLQMFETVVVVVPHLALQCSLVLRCLCFCGEGGRDSICGQERETQLQLSRDVQQCACIQHYWHTCTGIANSERLLFVWTLDAESHKCQPVPNGAKECLRNISIRGRGQCSREQHVNGQSQRIPSQGKSARLGLTKEKKMYFQGMQGGELRSGALPPRPPAPIGGLPGNQAIGAGPLHD